jgi:hypothetical protein
MEVEITEQSILEALHKVPREEWGQVLELLQSLESKATVASMGALPRVWTIAELRALPPVERDAILEKQAAFVEADYRNDPELAAFEEFGPSDADAEDAEASRR